jgi:hypothetical protein
MPPVYFPAENWSGRPDTQAVPTPAIVVVAKHKQPQLVADPPPPKGKPHGSSGIRDAAGADDQRTSAGQRLGGLKLSVGEAAWGAPAVAAVGGRRQQKGRPSRDGPELWRCARRSRHLCSQLTNDTMQQRIRSSTFPWRVLATVAKTSVESPPPAENCAGANPSNLFGVGCTQWPPATNRVFRLK